MDFTTVGEKKAGHRGSEAANYERRAFQRLKKYCRAKFLVPFSLPCQGFQQQWAEHSQSRRGNRRLSPERAEKYLKPMHALWLLLFMLKMARAPYCGRKNPGHDGCCTHPERRGEAFGVWGKQTSGWQQPDGEDSAACQGRAHLEGTVLESGPGASQPAVSPLSFSDSSHLLLGNKATASWSSFQRRQRVLLKWPEVDGDNGMCVDKNSEDETGWASEEQTPQEAGGRTVEGAWNREGFWTVRSGILPLAAVLFSCYWWLPAPPLWIFSVFAPAWSKDCSVNSDPEPKTCS